MGSKSTHQFPVLTTLEDDDLFYVVRETSPGVYVDRKVPRSLLPRTYLPAERLITNAEMLDIFDTPITLIAAPASDKIIVISMITMRAIGGTAPYTGDVRFGGNTINSGAFIIQTPIPNDSFPYAVIYPVNAGGSGVDQGMAPGEALRIIGAGADPTVGDCDVFVKVYYTLLDA